MFDSLTSFFLFHIRFERFVDTLTEEESEQITRAKEEKEEVRDEMFFVHTLILPTCAM